MVNIRFSTPTWELMIQTWFFEHFKPSLLGLSFDSEQKAESEVEEQTSIEARVIRFLSFSFLLFILIENKTTYVHLNNLESL
jgi:hypothetical protein